MVLIAGVHMYLYSMNLGAWQTRRIADEGGLAMMKWLDHTRCLKISARAWGLACASTQHQACLERSSQNMFMSILEI